MLKQILLLVLIFTLAACAQPAPAPTATFPPQTSTLTPAPTSTPSPTLTPTITPTPALWQIAISEYGIPEEQAQKLDALSGKVTFEKYDELVDGVVVQENGEDVYFYSFRYDSLIELADFDLSSFDEDFARSKEVSAYIEYKLLDVNYDMDHYRSALKNVLQKLVDQEKISAEDAQEMKSVPMTVFNSTVQSLGYSPETIKLFEVEGILPFVKNTGFMVKLNSPDNGPFTEHRLTVVAFPNPETGKLEFIKLKFTSNEEKIDGKFEEWASDNELLIVASYPSNYPYPDTTMMDTMKIIADGKDDEGAAFYKAMNDFYRYQDAEALMEPDIILLTH